MEKVIEFVKKNKIAVIIIVLVVVGGILIAVLKNRKDKAEAYTLTSVEELKIKEISKDISPFFDEIEDNESNEIDRYIMFALEYVYDKEGKDTLSLDEMIELISNKFNIDISKEQLENIGITPLMLDKSITYDMLKYSFHINKFELSNQDIAALKIVTYLEQGIKKISNNEFVVTYKKSVVTNPYEILNYYTELNNKSSEPNIDPTTGEIVETTEEPVTYDTTEINKYLRGEEKLSTIKKYINNDNINKVGQDAGTIEVVYIFDGEKILVNEINRK